MGVFIYRKSPVLIELPQKIKTSKHPNYLSVIDGIKIICIGTKPAQWVKNPLLSFTSKVDEQTGEIKSDTKIAIYRGLRFFLIPSTIADKTHCIIRGSLAKYYNSGRDNAFDFDLRMVHETIEELRVKFSINPFKAIVQHFEYGVNIEPSKPAKQIVRGLRAYQNSPFINLRLDEVFTGKQISRQEYAFKIYDKGIQVPKIKVNMLRVEIAVTSTKKAKKYGIKVFADLGDLTKLEPVKQELLTMWQEMIFYDRGMRYRQMNRKQKEKMLYYLDATNWEKFSPMQRKRAKEHFRILYDEFCTSITQKETYDLIGSKLQKLEANKCYDLRNFSEFEKSNKMLRFTHLDKPVKRNKKPSQNAPQKTPSKSVKKKLRKCKVCKVNISHKRSDAIYCSKRCNNSYHAKKRKEARHREKSKRTLK